MLGVVDIYSKRQKRLRGEAQDVFQYDDIPSTLRVQVVQILKATIGESFVDDASENNYRRAVDILCKEYGTFYLPPTKQDPYQDRFYGRELFDFILSEEVTDMVMDAIEVSFRVADAGARYAGYLNRANASKIADRAIEELNARLKEHGVGYQFVGREIVRVDSALIHAEAVKPALRLLNTTQYSGPHDEFLSAYEHYRHGNHKEALVECLKAFESTMKAICDKRGWPYNQNDTASKLITVLFANDLVAPFWQTQLTSLRSLLESGIPTGRNKLGGHGQGATPSTVPEHIVAYMLHMTASTLVFLTTAESKLP
jgi:hypothetical protein